MNLNSPRAKKAITAIFRSMEIAFTSGTDGVTFEFIVQAFNSYGYAPNMAQRMALALIKANTDIKHWSRWTKKLVNIDDKLYMFYSVSPRPYNTL
tara:strand:- start:780 stop:1064 length:285 start_codon:yes stop_codon:yes gene_type:complete